MNHEIKWNAANQEWFCVRCLRTSDLLNQEDAERELSQFDGLPPRPYPEIDHDG